MKNDDPIYPFAIVPVEVAMDTRLTLEMVRVLIALYSFRNKHTGLTCPSRESLAQRSGLHPSNISAATAKLSELGWIAKTGKGGYSKSTSYEITVPDSVTVFARLHKARSDAREAARKGESTVAHEATVAELATVAHGASSSGSSIGKTTVAHEASSASRPTGYTQITDKLTDKVTNPSSPDKSGGAEAETELQAACKSTWESYKVSYFSRYGIYPLRNASANAAIKSFCKKIPHEEAPHVAAFYVSHNSRFYVEKTHPPSLLNKDAEGLRTQWATGRPSTTEKFDPVAYVNRNRPNGGSHHEIVIEHEKRS